MAYIHHDITMEKRVQSTLMCANCKNMFIYFILYLFWGDEELQAWYEVVMDRTDTEHNDVADGDEITYMTYTNIATWHKHYTAGYMHVHIAAGFLCQLSRISHSTITFCDNNLSGGRMSDTNHILQGLIDVLDRWFKDGWGCIEIT